MKNIIPKISFHTIGCRLNQYETAVLRNTFGDGRYRIVSSDRPADIAVINTCTVTERSDTDARRLVNRLVRLNPDVRIALVGCQAQLQKDVLRRLPHVRWVIGNREKFALVRIIGEDQGQGARRLVVSVPPIGRPGPFRMPAYGIDPTHTRANLKIQDGCDCFCAYCEVPYARGPVRSREFSDIVREARVLADAGHKEIILSGINVGRYHFKNRTIVDVIKALEDISRIRRIRISSIEPTDILKDVIQYMRAPTKLCRYLHVPVQHGHDAILKKMGRRYSAEDFRETVLSAKERVPDLCIGTDVIAGFPGETDAHFEEMCKFLRGLPMEYFHVFSFSRRKRARAKDFGHQVPAGEIQERSRRLRALGKRKRRTFYERVLGMTVSVLFEQKKQGFWHGLTDNFIHVKVLSDKNLKNRIRRVRLQDVQGEWVIGEL